MRVKLEIPLSAGENGVFADGVAEAFVGQRTKDDQEIIAAERVEPGLIMLTIDFEVPPELESMFQPKEL